MMNDALEIGIIQEEIASEKTQGRFYDGESWVSVRSQEKLLMDSSRRPENPMSHLRMPSAVLTDKEPVAPVLDGDGKILVTIPSFRDGRLCGNALVELFQNAKDPDNIVVSLVEEQNDDDPHCLEVYCKSTAGVNVIERKEIAEGHNIVSNNAEKTKCPRIDQIRVLRIQDDFSKGPSWSRALGRRSLGNEEFCLQTASHGSFVEDWDEKVLKEWLSTNNEFGIISNPPKSRDDAASLFVPRLCHVDFLEKESLPCYDANPDGKVENLKQPLLAHTWSPGFSFSKCHLEETTPYDGFLPYVPSDIDAFARYARFWTRGYDVYTPTQNILYRQSGNQPREKDEWMTKGDWGGFKSTLRSQSLQRIRSYLEISNEDEMPAEKLDNLGNYGLGRRRTLGQLIEFVGIDLNAKKFRAKNATCGNFQWVPYNSEISPMENLYSNPDDLDPQPEYPMRTQPRFGGGSEMTSKEMEDNLESPSVETQSSDIPYMTLFIFWVFGLGLWCNLFISTQWKGSKRRKQRGRNTNKNK